MNLTEELAKREYKDFQEANPEYKDLEWERIIDGQKKIFTDSVKKELLPIISKWIDSVENPYKKRADKDKQSLVTSTAIDKNEGFNKAIAALKAALEK